MASVDALPSPTALARLPVSGTCDDSVLSIAVLADGVLAASAVPSGGAWSAVLVDLSEGSHVIAAVAMTRHGASTPTPPQTLVVDRTPPPPPTIAPVRSPTIELAPTLLITTEPAATVAVQDGEVLLAAVAADATGVALVPLLLVEGAHRLRANATDQAGNTSPLGATTLLLVDLTPPGIPTVTWPADGDVVPLGATRFTGTSEEGSTIALAVDGQQAGAAAGGVWTVAATLEEGVHLVTVSATDAAGNASAATTLHVEGRRLPVAAPTLDPIASPTNRDSIPVSGTCAPEATGIAVLVDGVEVASSAPVGGTWSAILTGVAEGTHSVTAIASNAYGASPASEPRTVTVDRTLGAPVILSPTAGAPVPEAAVISGLAPASETVTLEADQVVVATVKADESGAWTANALLSPGLVALRARTPVSVYSTTVTVSVEEATYSFLVPGVSLGAVIPLRGSLYRRVKLAGLTWIDFNSAYLSPSPVGPQEQATWSHILKNHLIGKGRGQDIAPWMAYVGPGGPLNKGGNPYNPMDWIWSTGGVDIVNQFELVGAWGVWYAQTYAVDASTQDDYDYWTNAAEKIADLLPLDPVTGVVQAPASYGTYSDAGSWDAVYWKTPYQSLIGSMYRCWIYKALLNTARKKGDTALETRSLAKYGAAVDALRTFRRSDGYYSTNDQRPDARNLLCTNLIVANGFCTTEERIASATRLRDDYVAGAGHHNTYRGHVRLLAWEDYFNPADPSKTFVDGGYWAAGQTFMAASALTRVDLSKASQLFTEYSDEMQRQRRIGGAPWEYVTDASAGSPIAHGNESLGWYSIGTLAVESMTDSLRTALAGAPGASVFVPTPHGHRVTEVELTAPRVATVTVSFYAQEESNVDGEPLGPTGNWKAEVLMGTATLSSGMTTGRVAVKPYPGQRIRVAVTAGDASGLELEAKLHQPVLNPTMTGRVNSRPPYDVPRPIPPGYVLAAWDGVNTSPLPILSGDETDDNITALAAGVSWDLYDYHGALVSSGPPFSWPEYTGEQSPQTGKPTVDPIPLHVNSASWPVTGTAPPGASVRVRLGATVARTVTAAGDGAFTASLSLTDRSRYDITATAQEAGKAESGPSPTQTTTVEVLPAGVMADHFDSDTLPLYTVVEPGIAWDPTQNVLMLTPRTAGSGGVVVRGDVLADAFAELELIRTSAFRNRHALYLRYVDAHNWVRVYKDDWLEIDEMVGGFYARLTGPIGNPFPYGAPTCPLRFEAQGSTLKLYFDDGNGGGYTLRATVTTSHLAPGKVGIGLSEPYDVDPGQESRVDDLEYGPLP